jgi:hypothetical protein
MRFGTHLWIVDPLARTVEAYRLAREQWTAAATHAGGGRVRLEPFAAIEIELDRWWNTGEIEADAAS